MRHGKKKFGAHSIPWDKVPWGSIPWGSVAIFVFAASLWIIPSARHIEDELARRVEFHLREVFDKHPRLDERIKVFAFDDASAAAEYSQESVSLHDWALVIQSLAGNKPERIIFDKMFSFPDKDEKENRFFVETVQKTGVDVFAASFPIEKEIHERPALDLSVSCYPSKHDIPWKNLVSDSWKFYGSAKEITPAFANTGHIRVTDHSRYPIAFFRSDGSCSPFLAAVASKSYSFGKDFIDINGTNVFPDFEGNIQPNITYPKNYYAKTFSLKSVFALGRSGEAVPVIQPGDTVIVLPAMYTGNVDFRATPLGVMESGFFHVANMNSVLSGQWLRMRGYGRESPFILLIAAILGALYARYFSPIRASVIVSLNIFAVFIGAILLFVSRGNMVFWLLPIVTLAFSAIAETIIKYIVFEQRSRKVGMALEGLVPRHVLKSIMQNPKAMEFRPAKISISIMFIDVEGFSARFAGIDPDLVFASLQRQLSRLGEIVHAHGGIIDKTLGDGLLAFFGHSYDPSEPKSTTPHILQALDCAAAIQQEWALRMVQSPEVSRPLSVTTDIQAMPLRIGINSGDVYLGNLGAGKRVDVTIVGDAVNFAKRLEESANLFRIMIGGQAKEILSTAKANNPNHVKQVALRRVLLQIKHRVELVEAWEVDPFCNNPALLRQALDVARGQAERKNTRTEWLLTQDFEVTINGSGKGKLVDFSDSGICVETAEYYGRKVQVTIELATNIQGLQNQLRENDLATLLAEVRWGAPLTGKTKHGFRILNLSYEQRQKLHRTLMGTMKLNQ